MLTLSALLLTLSTYQPTDMPGTPAGTEGIVQACIADCQATYETPGWELKACVTKCLELGSK